MPSQRPLRRNLSAVLRCTRCRRPALRERLPVLTLVQTFAADPQQLKEAVSYAQAGDLMGLGGASFAMMPTDVDFPPKSESVLCLRCSVAFQVFLEGLTEEETTLYNELDTVKRDA